MNKLLLTITLLVAITACAGTKNLEDFEQCVAAVDRLETALGCRLQYQEASFRTVTDRYGGYEIETSQNGLHGVINISVPSLFNQVDTTPLTDVDIKRQRYCYSSGPAFRAGITIREIVGVRGQSPMLDHTFSKEDCEQNGYEVAGFERS